MAKAKPHEKSSRIKWWNGHVERALRSGAKTIAEVAEAAEVTPQRVSQVCRDKGVILPRGRRRSGMANMAGHPFKATADEMCVLDAYCFARGLSREDAVRELIRSARSTLSRNSTGAAAREKFDKHLDKLHKKSGLGAYADGDEE